MSFDHDAQQAREFARQQLVEYLVGEVDRMLLDESDGSVEMTNRLTVEVAELLFKMATVVISSPGDQFVGADSVLKAKIRGLVCQQVGIFDETDEAVRSWLKTAVADKFHCKVTLIFNSAIVAHDFNHPAQQG